MIVRIRLSSNDSRSGQQGGSTPRRSGIEGARLDEKPGLRDLEKRIPVLPDAAAGLKAIAQDRLRWLDDMFGFGPYLCGERFSAADIWLYVWLDFALTVNQPFDRTLPNLGPWFARMAMRPSAALSQQLLVSTSG